MAKNIVVQFENPRGSFLKIPLDKEMIVLAVQNILDNAIKYTPKGGT